MDRVPAIVEYIVLSIHHGCVCMCNVCKVQGCVDCMYRIGCYSDISLGIIVWCLCSAQPGQWPLHWTGTCPGEYSQYTADNKKRWLLCFINPIPRILFQHDTALVMDGAGCVNFNKSSWGAVVMNYVAPSVT